MKPDQRLRPRVSFAEKPHDSELKRIPHGPAVCQRLVELCSDGDRVIISNGGAHADGAIDHLDDRLRLGLGVAGVEEDDLHVILQHPEQPGQRLDRDLDLLNRRSARVSRPAGSRSRTQVSSGRRGIAVNHQLPRGRSVAAEMNDVGLMPHQQPREVVEPYGPVREQLQLVPVSGALDLTVDCADLLVERKLGGGRGIGGEEEDLDHRASESIDPDCNGDKPHYLPRPRRLQTL